MRTSREVWKSQVGPSCLIAGGLNLPWVSRVRYSSEAALMRAREHAITEVSQKMCQLLTGGFNKCVMESSNGFLSPDRSNKAQSLKIFKKGSKIVVDTEHFHAS